MSVPQSVMTALGEVQIAPATLEEIPAVLALFDESVAWLAEKGLTGQWGTTPFSQLPRMRERLVGWVERRTLFVARLAGEVVGVLSVGPEVPPYAVAEWEARPATAYYLEAFTTRRRVEGKGLGGALLRWAEGYTGAHGIDWLRLDCWADNPGLVGYYRRQGYTPVGEVNLGTWRGQLMEKRLGGVEG
ncbi:MAG: GNAT family N-acetyltransferase [Bacillota bacterium]